MTGLSDCEAIRDAFLAQPVNALTALAFIGAGVWISNRKRTSLLGGATLAVGLGALAFHGPMPSWADTAHDVTIAALVLVALGEVALGIRRRGIGSTSRLLVPAFVVTAVGFVLDLLGGSGGPWCDPDSLIQWHGVWHLCAAVGIALLTRLRTTRGRR